MTKSHLLSAAAIGLVFASAAEAQTTGQNAEASAPAAQSTREGAAADEIIVTASRNPTVLSEVPGSVSIIAGERLEDQLDVSRDLNDVIGKVSPGLISNNELSFSDGTGPIVRGRPASVLINGVPVNQLLRSSGFDLGLIDPSSIDRIEVNRGASAVFGFGASGGVINISTRRGRTATPQIVTNIGTSFHPSAVGDSLSGRAYVGIGAAPGKLDYYIGGGYQRNRPTFDARGKNNRSQDVNVFNVDGQLGIALTESSELRFTGNYFRRNFNQEYLPPAYYVGRCSGNPDDDDFCSAYVLPAGLQAGDFFTAIPQPFGGVKDQFQQNVILTANYSNDNVLGQKLSVTTLYQKNKIFYAQGYSDGVENPSIISMFTSPMTDKRFGIRSSLTAEIPLGAERALEVTYGLDYIKDSLIRTSEFGGPIQRPLLYNIQGLAPYYLTGGPNRPISPPVSLAGYAGFIQTQAKLGNFILSGGVRHEEARPRAERYVVQNVFESGSDLIYNGGKMQKFNATLYNAGAVWQLATSSELYAGIAQGVEVSQLGRAYRGQAQIGKPGDPANISAQAAITTQYELGFRARTGPLNATGALFFAKAPLSAQVVPDPSPECRTFPQTRPCPLINLRQRERIWGFEGTAEYTFSPAFLMGGVFTYQNGQSRKDDDTDAKWKRLTTDRITPARLTGYAQFRPMERIKARLQGTHSFDRDGKTPAGFYPYGNYDALDTEVKSFFIMDALVEVDTFGGDLTLGVENLLNKKYFPPLTQVYADLYESSYGEGRRVSLSFKRTF